MEIDDLAENLVKQYPQVKLFYIFGSRSSGKVGPLSDYDFAVYLDEKDSARRFDLKLALLGELCGLLRRDDVDLVVINDVEAPELKYNILKGGRLLYEKEPFKLIVEPRILNEYFDFRASLRKYCLTKS